MTTLAISAAGNSTITGLAGLMHQRRQDFKSIEKEIKSGNIQGAQSAMAAWQLVSENIQKIAGPSSPAGSQGIPSFQNDLSAFTNAIKSGNIGSSQSMLAKLQQDRQSVSVAGASSQTSAEFVNDLQAMLKGVQLTNPTSQHEGTGSSSNINTAAQAAYSMIMKLQAGSNFNSLA